MCYCISTNTVGTVAYGGGMVGNGGRASDALLFEFYRYVTYFILEWLSRLLTTV